MPRTVAPIEEVRFYTRDASGQRTYVALLGLIEARRGATVTRVDLHLSRSRDGGIFNTSRKDGSILCWFGFPIALAQP